MSLARDSKEDGAPKSPWSFRLLSVSGIPIRIHFTFLLFLVWIYLQSQGQLMSFGLIVAVFVCVLLHELGHALTARKYAIETRDITLYPIGGVAMLDGRPSAKAELWIALAGPAVNVVIAAILAVVLFVARGGAGFAIANVPHSFLAALLTANVWLVVFNMIPAFPMDGGRVLRSLLARRMDETKATQAAAAIGQGLAIAAGFYGLISSNPILMIIALFVFIGAGQEASMSVTRSFLQGHTVRDAMQQRFRTIPHGSKIETAAEMLLAGSQHDFPVTLDDEVLGMLTRNRIAEGLATAGPGGYVANHMNRDVKSVAPTIPLEEAIELFGGDQTPILVMEDGQLIGMVTQENLSEFIMLQHARQQARASYGYRA